MKKRIGLLLVIVLLIAFCLIVIGSIGANINFEDVTIEVFNFKNLFNGIFKISPLILILSVLAILSKKVN